MRWVPSSTERLSASTRLSVSARGSAHWASSTISYSFWRLRTMRLRRSRYSGMRTGPMPMASCGIPAGASAAVPDGASGLSM